MILPGPLTFAPAAQRIDPLHTHLLPASMLRSCLLMERTSAPAAATSRCISFNARASLRCEAVMPSCISRAYGRRMPAHTRAGQRRQTQSGLLLLWLLLLSGVQRALCGVPHEQLCSLRLLPCCCVP